MLTLLSLSLLSLFSLLLLGEQAIAVSLRREHSVQWETLPSSRLAQWYQPWELCMFLKNESVKYFSNEAVQGCLDKQKRMKRPGAILPGRGKFNCRMGHVYHNVPCVFGTQTYLPNMTHFFKAVRGFDDPDQTHLQAVLRNLIVARAAIVFMGDSTLNAFLGALMCELERENVTSIWRKNDVLVHGTNYYRIKEDGPEVKLMFKQNNEIRAHHLDNMRKFAEYFLEAPENNLDGVVIVVQAGTWYNIIKKFQINMKVVFDSMYELAHKYAKVKKFVTFVWAEQVTQHWPSKNGYFVTSKGLPLKPFCHQLKNSTPEADWRNDIIWNSYLSDSSPWRQKVDALAPYARIRVLNFRSLTSDLHDMHVRQRQKDCTHFCYSPFMYQKIYHELSVITADMASDVSQMTQIETKNNNLFHVV